MADTREEVALSAGGGEVPTTGTEATAAATDPTTPTAKKVGRPGFLASLSREEKMLAGGALALLVLAVLVKK